MTRNFCEKTTGGLHKNASPSEISIKCGIGSICDRVRQSNGPRGRTFLRDGHNMTDSLF